MCEFYFKGTISVHHNFGCPQVARYSNEWVQRESNCCLVYNIHKLMTKDSCCHVQFISLCHVLGCKHDT